MFGEFGSPEGMAEAEVAAGTMSEAEAFGSFDTPEGPGNLGGGGGGEGNLMGNYAVPTGSFQSDTPIADQIQSNNIFANAVKAAMAAMVPGLGMMQGFGRVLGSFVGNTENFNFPNRASLEAGLRAQYTDPNTYDFDTLTQGYPTSPYDEKERQGLISAKMSGFGARKGIATGIDPYTGLHVGPGYPMSEDFFPGYGVNPYSNDPMAEGGGDTYIRKRRGTEIAGMI